MAILMVSNQASLKADPPLANVSQGATEVARLATGARVKAAAKGSHELKVARSAGTSAREINAASKRSNDAISMTQVAEQALQKMGDVLERMRLAATQSMSGALDAKPNDYLHRDFCALRDEMDRIAEVAEYDGLKMLDGSLAGGVLIDLGVRSGQTDQVSVAIGTTTAKALGLSSGQSLASASISTANSAASALVTVDSAIAQVASERSALSGVQSRVTMSLTRLSVMADTAASEAPIREPAQAEATAQTTKDQIREKANIAVLAQSKRLSLGAISLVEQS